MEEIKDLITHIILIIAIVIVSIIIWPNTDLNLLRHNEGVKLTFDGYKELSILTDEDYENAIPSNIYLENISKNSNSFYLYYKYAKNSSIDYHNVSISLDDKIYNLNKLEMYEDSDYYYFKLNNYSLESNASETINTRIWTNEYEGTVSSTFVAA